MYQDTERLNQVIHNNQTKLVTVGGRDFSWTAGQVSSMEILSEEENDEDIKGLHSSFLEFSCLVSRES